MLNFQVLAFGFHRRPTPEQKGARDFIFWHWAQLQFQNPKVQLVKYVDFTPIPFVQAFLGELFFFLKSPHNYWLNSLRWLVELDRYTREYLGVRSTDELQASPFGELTFMK